MEGFTSTAVITEIKTTSDGGYKIKIDLPELEPEDMTKLLQMKGKEGAFAFAPDPNMYG